MRDFRKIIIVLVVIIFILQMIVTKEDKKNNNLQTKKTVTVTTFPLYNISNYISNGTINVNKLLPFGADVHTFKLNSKDMIKLYESDLVIYNGTGLEPWIRNFDFKKDSMDISKKVNLLEIENSHNHTHSHNETHKTDPHYWLDIKNMIIATNAITNKFIKLNKQNENLYIKKRDEYVKILQELNDKYKNSLSSCKKDTIIVDHNAFSYLSNEYKFNIISLRSISSEAQAQAKKMAEIVKYINDNKIKTIFYEKFSSNNIFKNISKETDAGIESLQTLANIEKDEFDKNFNYEKIMILNLEKISKALECN